MPKIPKVQAGYLPAKFVPRSGTSCGTCRDFIVMTSECMVIDPPSVSRGHGTCCLYVQGQPHQYGKPLHLIPAAVVGYIEGIHDVPTHCGKCEHYEHPGHYTSTCAGVGNSDNDVVEFGGCCNLYQLKTNKEK